MKQAERSCGVCYDKETFEEVLRWDQAANFEKPHNNRSRKIQILAVYSWKIFLRAGNRILEIASERNKEIQP